jgi:glycosyltransferase involved in cell wall biosynthesis
LGFPGVPPRRHLPTSPLPTSPSRPVRPRRARRVVPAEDEERWSWWTAPDLNDDGIIVPNGVNLKRFEVQKKESDEEVVIGFIGSILPYHGVDELIMSFAELSKSNPNCRLLIVGDGYSLEDLKELCEGFRISAKVTFTGKVDRSKLGGYLKQMDICVLANTKWYCSPIKLFEYAASGKSIVAPKTAPVQEIFDHKENAYLFEQNKLNEALEELIKNGDLRTKLALNSRKLVESKFQWKTLAQRVIDQMEKQK